MAAEDWALDLVAAPVAEAVRAGAVVPVAEEVYGTRVSRERRPEQAAEQRAEVGPEEVRLAAPAQVAAEVRELVDPEAEMGEV